MWTLLPKDDLAEYESHYKLFEKYPEREYILHINDKHVFLPRYFYENYPFKKLIHHIDKAFNPQAVNDLHFTQSLRDYQIPIVKSFIDKYNENGYVNGLLNARPGAGKCHGKGTKILLYNGNIKNVEDIEVDELLMGDDSTPRRVLSTTVGYGRLYNIIPRHGEPFVCNEDHILSLKDSDGNITNIEIYKFITLNNQSEYKLWRTAVEFEEVDIDIPYSSILNTDDSDLVHNYIINSSRIRFLILASILDEYGILISNTEFHISINTPNLQHIIFLARSLGFNVYEIYRNISISGNIYKIPCIKHNIEEVSNYNTDLTSSFTIEFIGYGNYYGFELDGNHLYLLHDFIVTHNTALSIYLACELRKKTLIVVDNEKLKAQFIESIVNFTNLTEDDIGFIQGSKFDSDKKITITLVQTLLSKLKRNLKESYIKIRNCGFDLVIYDEVHKTSAGPKYAMSTLFLNTQNVIGLSATPYVRDAHALLLFNTIGNIVYTAKDYDFIPKIIYVNYNSNLDNKKKYRAVFLKDYIKLQSFYNSIIFDNIHYLNILLKIAQKCINTGHRIIILVSTIKQIDSIINHFSRFGVTAKAIYSKQPDIDKENDRLLVGTFKFCSHGFDYAELSALVLGSPYKGKVSLVQSIGRILRSSKDKKPPVVFDLVDSQFPSLFANAIKSKTAIFEDEFGHCDIQNVYFND